MNPELISVSAILREGNFVALGFACRAGQGEAEESCTELSIAEQYCVH